MFVVFVPRWKDSPGYQNLEGSTFLLKQLVLESGKHYYAEGTQYRRAASYRLASFSTSIFFLLNDKAREKWVISDSILDNLIDAFTMDPTSIDNFSDHVQPTRSKEKASLPVLVPKISHLQECTSDSTKLVRHGTTKQGNDQPHSPKKSGKQGKKRKLLDGPNESNNQLDLLHSLGLAERNSKEAQVKVSTSTCTSRKQSKSRIKRVKARRKNHKR